MKLAAFNFPLPESSIAAFPAAQRDESRLMMVNRATGEISHHLFRDIVNLTSADDFFVVNNSQVVPVKLFGTINGKIVELLIVKTLDPFHNEVEVLALPARKFVPGQQVLFTTSEGQSASTFYAEVLQCGHRGRRVLRFSTPLENVLKAGYAPLPPYIKRKYSDATKYRRQDLERYQTVYSKNPGSIAAPTAGLHFTPQILQQLTQRSPIIELTLNVGEATFQKIEVEDITDHKMGIEHITITMENRKTIQHLKQTKKLIAVGTTSVRSLETYALEQPEQESFLSQLFISPGFQFRIVDKLITNFHLPESSLFILVSAFAGLELMQKAYAIAIAEGYRFFSYGDAMFIV